MAENNQEQNRLPLEITRFTRPRHLIRQPLTLDTPNSPEN